MKANVCVFSHVTRAKQVTNEASQCCVGGRARAIAHLERKRAEQDDRRRGEMEHLSISPCTYDAATAWI
jgi:hypothetical protein